MFRRRFVADTVLYPGGGPYIATLHHVLVYHVPAEPLAPDCSPVARSTSSSPPPSVPRPPLAAGWMGCEPPPTLLQDGARSTQHTAHSTQHTASPTWLMELPHRGAGHHLSPPSRDPSCQSDTTPTPITQHRVRSLRLSGLAICCARRSRVEKWQVATSFEFQLLRRRPSGAAPSDSGHLGPQLRPAHPRRHSMLFTSRTTAHAE